MTATVLGACSDPAPVPRVVATTTTTEVESDDGVLRLGVLRPTGAAATDLNPSLLAGVEQAVDELRAAGVRIEVVQRDEGDPQLTRASLTEMVDTGVDAIIGPMSSTVALATLSTPVAAGIPSCSPTASALALDEFPDRGLFFRTVPSDSLQARGVADLVDRTGAAQAALLFVDDDYGRPFADAVEVALRARVNVRRIPFRTDESAMIAAAESAMNSPDQAVILIGDSTAVPAMLRALVDAGIGELPIVVNDAARRTIAAASANLKPELITGLSIQSVDQNSAFYARFHERHPTLSGTFAEKAYHCVNLFALAALVGHSTLPGTIAANVEPVSAGGSLCNDYADCKRVFEAQRNIDYRAVTLTPDGELATAAYDVFTVRPPGGDTTVGAVRVSR